MSKDMNKATKDTTSIENQTKPSKNQTTSVASSKKSATEKQTNKTSVKEKTSQSQKDSNTKLGRGLVLSLVFLIALSAIGLAGYDYYLLRAQVPVNEQLIKLQDSFKTRISKLEQQLQNNTSQLSAEKQARVTAQSERSAINSALQGISEKLGRSTVAWRMAEVEYLLTVANHRLTLAKDRQTTIAVFETADNRLKAIADPSLLSVRKKIAGELTALRAVPNVDIAGIAVQIGSLAESVKQLPLLDKKRLEVATEKQNGDPPRNWQEIPAAVWSDVKNLVQVRRHQQPTEPLLPPKQAWFLYQNLQLKLEQARLAVLQKNTVMFGQSLIEASHWLDSYFEVESVAVVSMQTTLKKLLASELNPTVPDVSGSLRELRTVMNARSNLKLSLVNSPANIPAEAAK